MMLKEKAYNGFKEKLFSLELKPGQFVSQSELSKLLEVPIGALREAIQKLEWEELVRVIPQRGIQIADINVKLVREAFQLRIFLEKEAVRYFINNASDSAIEKLEGATLEIIERKRSKSDEKLLNDALRVDYLIHQTIIDKVGNELLSNVWKVNLDRIKMIRLHGHYTANRILPAMQEHLEIIRAMKSRDPEAAVEALEKHLNTAMMRALGFGNDLKTETQEHL